MEENKDLDFLFYVCDGMNKPSLRYWISVPEFAERIRYMKSCGVTIDKQVVFEAMRSIYLDYEKTDEYAGKKRNFGYNGARKGIVTLWESMTGTKEGWRGE